MFYIEEYQKELKNIIQADVKPEVIAEGYYWSEGPIWDGINECLYFTDFKPNRIFRWKEGRGTEVIHENSNSACGLTFDQNGGILCAEAISRSITTLSLAGESKTVIDKWEGKKFNSPNDLIVKSDGSIYFTDPYSPDLGNKKEIRENGVYCMKKDGGLFLAADMNRPNGLAFSPDEKFLYVDDTNLQQVWRYEVKADGRLINGELFVQLDSKAGPGGADGMKADCLGNLYVTGPGGIWIFSDQGEVLGRIHFPEIAANLCFGGTDRKTLFVTAQSKVYRLQMKIAGDTNSSQRYGRRAVSR